MLGYRATSRDPVAAPPAMAGHELMRLLAEPSAAESPVEPWRALGCQRDPFAATPDPADFFTTPAAQKLYMSLLTVLRIGDGGLLLVTGEAGVGKTLLLHVLQNTLQTGGETVRLLVGSDAAWLDELDGVAGGPTTHDILLVDGAEAWDGGTIARLERLYELDGGRARALRLVICGRPEIEQRLQRLIATAAGGKLTFARLRLDPLEPGSLADLIRHRLRVAGAFAEGPLTYGAVQAIAESANGNPRQALAACQAALQVEPAAPPSDPAPPRMDAHWKRWGIAAALALLAAGAGAGAIRLLPPPAAAPVASAPAAVVAAAPAPAPAEPTPAVAAAPQRAAEPPPEIAAPVYTAALAAISPAAGPPEPKRSALDTAFTLLRQAAATPPRRATGQPAAPDLVAVVAAEPAPRLVAVVPPSAPDPTPNPAPEPLTMTAAEVAALTERGDAYLRLGDIASARPFYERAAEAGDANAALLLGQTYDPGLLARAGLRGARGDAVKAAEWYRRAASLGASEAERLLAELAPR